MTLSIQTLLTGAGFTCLGVAAVYASLNVVAVLFWRIAAARDESPPGPPDRRPPITLLKPLCGAEPGLYEHLKSFCRQDHAEFQIIFGVRDPADPACDVVKRLMAEFPDVPIELIVDPRLHGDNRKISNLINMLPHARHEMLAIADSDACVGPDYLRSVTAPLHEPDVGLVTCVYRGLPTRTPWSRLGAMYVNEWYVPSVLVAWLFGHQDYVSGQTICLRQETLRSLGGLPMVVNHLADDYLLGQRVRDLGLRIVLSPYVIRAEHHETSLSSLARHELRWMRTLKILRPRSFRWLFLTFSLPLAGLGGALVATDGAASGLASMLFGVTLSSRLLLHLAHRASGERALLADLWLLPFRDLLLCWLWGRSFFISRVSWRGQEFDVDPDGVMHRLS